MRQLDLFSMFETETLVEKQEEKIVIHQKEEILFTEVTRNEAKEMFADIERHDSQPYPELPVAITEFTSEKLTIDHVVNTDVVSMPAAVDAANVAEPFVQPGYGSYITPNTEEVKAENKTNNGAVIFNNGKIAVKLKAKPVIVSEPARVKKEKTVKTPQKRGRKSFKEIDAEIDLVAVPEDDVLFQKQYYSISEVAGWFRVNTSLLRFWENEFDILKPRKNRKGDRLFRPEDVKNLQLIYQLLRQRKYTIEGAKEYMKANKKKADMQVQLTTTLQKFKTFLLDLRGNLQV